MRLKGPVQSEVLIICILLIVTKASIITDNTERTMTGSTNHQMKTTKPPAYLHSKAFRDQIKTLRYVWVHVRYALKHIQGKKEDLQKFYSKVLPALNPSFEDELLPTAPSNNDFHAIRHLEKHIKISRMIPVFYNTSEMYQIVFQDMVNVNSQNQYVAQSDFYEKRRAFLSTFEDDLNSILYHLENLFQSFELKTERVNKAEVRDKWQKRDPSRDFTSMLYHDWRVITRYYRFIKAWNNILTEIFQNYCNVMAINHKCRQYLKDGDT